MFGAQGSVHIAETHICANEKSYTSTPSNFAIIPLRSGVLLSPLVQVG